MANPEDLGRYRLKRLLGRGVLGEVWEASDLEQQGNKVAVKIMHAADDELALARSHFAREARLASMMRHPHVVAVHDAGEAAGTSFMVMDMVEGKSLRALMKDPGTTTNDKLRWLRQIGDGLSAMHRAGVVHRDLKPENVIVRADRSACLVDLGIAKWTKFDLGGERDPDDLEALEAPDLHPTATSNYVPPETAEQHLYDELGDQYAFGILAYEMLTGSIPKEESPSLTFLAKEDVPHEVAVAIDRARSIHRDDRWDGMELLLDELVDHNAKSEAPTSGPKSKATKAKTKTSTSSSPPASEVPSTKPSGGASPDDAGVKSVPAKAASEASLKTPEETGPRISPVVIVVGLLFLVLVVGIIVALR